MECGKEWENKQRHGMPITSMASGRPLSVSGIYFNFLQINVIQFYSILRLCCCLYYMIMHSTYNLVSDHLQ
jgi:hypothetical protein